MMLRGYRYVSAGAVLLIRTRSTGGKRERKATWNQTTPRNKAAYMCRQRRLLWRGHGDHLAASWMGGLEHGQGRSHMGRNGRDYLKWTKFLFNPFHSPQSRISQTIPNGPTAPLILPKWNLLITKHSLTGSIWVSTTISQPGNQQTALGPWPIAREAQQPARSILFNIFFFGMLKKI